MYKTFILLFFIMTFEIFSQSTFDFKIIDDIDIASYYMIEDEANLLIEVMVNRQESTLAVYSFAGLNKKLNNIPGSIQLFVSSLKGNGLIVDTTVDWKRKVFLYNLHDKIMRPYNGIDWLLENVNSQSFYWFPYQNGEAFIQFSKYIPGDSSPPSEYGVINNEEQHIISKDYGRMMVGISDDKMHLLMTSENEDFLSIMNIQTRNISETKASSFTWAQEAMGEGFISNSLYFARPKGRFYSNRGNGKFEMFKIGDTDFMNKIQFTVSGEGLTGIAFHSSLNFALAVKYNDAYIVDTTPFRDWLLDQGLLFHETTGMITGTPDLREYPNLEAQIFGTLEPGSLVKVYDQSGIQVEISEHKDWWYEIETETGEKGWIYGPYIQIDEPVVEEKAELTIEEQAAMDENFIP